MPLLTVTLIALAFQQFADDAVHVVHVRAFPVNLAAAGTTEELAVVATRQRFEAGPYLFPGNRFYLAVAIQAALPRRDLIVKVQAPQHFPDLGVDIDRPDPEAMRHRLAKQ